MEDVDGNGGVTPDHERSHLAKRRHGPILSLVTLALVAALIFGGLIWRKHSINGTVQTALAGETGAETTVYRRALLGGNEIVFDVRSTSGEISMVDMTRRLLKTAEALKDSSFDRVYLSSAGRERFYLEGSYFKRLGEEREWQNPIYTIRTMPENIRNLDGTQAFGSWSGGFIGVMGGQMEDNAKFHREWWANDALTQLRD